MPTLFHVVTVPISLSFLKRQAGYIGSAGFDVCVISSPGPELERFAKREGVSFHAIPMTRVISPFRDLVSVIRLARFFRARRPDIVHAHTPKAGLLAIVAAFLTGVPCRIFHIHGHPHSTARGLARTILKLSTRIPAALATRVLCVSASSLDVAVAEGLCVPDKISVVAGGSSNGVDAEQRFSPDGLLPDDKFKPNGGDLVIGFAGRLVCDKGIRELHAAWRRIRAEFPNTRLLIAGAPEQRDAVPGELLNSFRSDERVRFLGWTNDMPAFYSAIDVLALPSYREGLPTVVLEAAAMQVPAVAARSVGCVDAVVDGVTGLLVEPGDSYGLAGALRAYLTDPELRVRHGHAARERVLRDFRPEDVWRATLAEYQAALDPTRRSRSRLAELAARRLMDITVSAATLFLLAPLLAVIALFIRITIGRPVFFRQTRPGFRERPFQLIKFRTMRDAFDAAGQPLPDDQRLTRIGRFLRASSLDELPELWNVLRGEMSLVGPRPLLPQYLPRYTEFQRRRHQVKPGLTGWAQVNGRNGLSWEQKFEHDVWYVDHRSLLLDFHILWRTVAAVLRREGIASHGHATMPEFMGLDR